MTSVVENGTSTVAHQVAARLASHGVRRVYGLCGGHVQPLWDLLSRVGIEIVDVRHESAAVYMAHAEAELTDSLGVALVTAGPGLTNALTAVANAWSSRIPVLVLSGRPPRPQAGTGAMQELPQAAMIAPVCRQVEELTHQHHVIRRLDRAIAGARGVDGPAGPAYVEFPADLWDEVVPAGVADHDDTVVAPLPDIAPSDRSIHDAATLLRSCRRPLVVSGHPVRTCADELARFLEATGALYLDTSASRGALHPEHPAYVPAVRSRALQEADLVVTVGRRLDFQLAFGSAVAFAADARFVRIGRTYEEIGENRRGDAVVQSDPGLALARLVEADISPTAPDRRWLADLRDAHRERRERLVARMRTSTDPDGMVHPLRLVGAVNDALTDDAIVVVDGGDILSFARMGLRAVRYMDCGPLGCLGVGIPFATAAALHSDAPVIGLIGDGSAGFTAMEIDTAVRTGAKALFIIANNAGWNIERHDQVVRYGGHTVGVALPDCRYDLVAAGLGAYAERIDDPDTLDAAIQRGLANAPALLDVTVSPTPMSPDFTSGLAEVPPLHALRSWSDAEAAIRRSTLGRRS